MSGQSFFYCSFFSTFPLVMTDYFNVLPEDVGYYVLPFSITNVIGALMLSRLFDTVGRVQLLFWTYFVSAFALFIVSLLFYYFEVSENPILFVSA